MIELEHAGNATVNQCPNAVDDPAINAIFPLAAAATQSIGDALQHTSFSRLAITLPNAAAETVRIAKYSCHEPPQLDS